MNNCFVGNQKESRDPVRKMCTLETVVNFPHIVLRTSHLYDTYGRHTYM